MRVRGWKHGRSNSPALIIHCVQSSGDGKGADLECSVVGLVVLRWAEISYGSVGIIDFVSSFVNVKGTHCYVCSIIANTWHAGHAQGKGRNVGL